MTLFIEFDYCRPPTPFMLKSKSVGFHFRHFLEHSMDIFTEFSSALAMDDTYSEDTLLGYILCSNLESDI